jgi:hypothetical protein
VNIFTNWLLSSKFEPFKLFCSQICPTPPSPCPIKGEGKFILPTHFEKEPFFPICLNLTHNSRTSTLNLPPSTFHLQPSTFNLPPSTFHLQPSTFNLQPSTFHLPPSTFHLPASTFQLSASTFHLPAFSFQLQS